MKDKSVIFGAIAGFLIIASFIGYRFYKTQSKIPKPGKNEYGFKSAFTDEYDEEDQLRNYPTIKEKMLELEPKILETGLEIDGIKFSMFGVKGLYYLGNTPDAQDLITIEFNKDQDSDEYKFYAVSAKIFDDSKYEQAKKAICSFAGLSEDEVKLVDEITTEDGIQTMEYYIDYSETDGQEKKYDGPDIKMIDVKYKTLKISDNPAENEMQTNLYAVKREERRPKADGEDIDLSSYGLSLFIPNGFTANEYNGLLYVWDYYTGSYVGNAPDGVDVNIKINGLEEGKDFDTYVRNDSRPAKSTGVTPFVTKEINGHTWYTCNNGTIYYYGAEFNGNAYEIEVRNGKTYNGITLQSTLDMIEKTLFFE